MNEPKSHPKRSNISNNISYCTHTSWNQLVCFSHSIFVPSHSSPFGSACRVLMCTYASHRYLSSMEYMFKNRWVCMCASARVWMCVAYCLFWNRRRWHLVDNGIPIYYYWQLIAFSLHYAEQHSSSAARFIRFSRLEFAFNCSIILNSFINSVTFVLYGMQNNHICNFQYEWAIQ